MAAKANRPFTGFVAIGMQCVDDLLYPYTSLPGEARDRVLSDLPMIARLDGTVRVAALETRTSFRLHRVFAESYDAGNPTRLSEADSFFDEKIASLSVHESPESAWVLRGEADTQPDLQANGTTLIVLMDSRTGSAGEGFVYLLRQFENVVFVGENTKGSMVSASPAWGTLPHSRLPFVLVVDISLKDAREGLEGIGYKPDIRVDPGSPMERVRRYMQSCF